MSAVKYNVKRFILITSPFKLAFCLHVHVSWFPLLRWDWDMCIYLCHWIKIYLVSLSLCQYMHLSYAVISQACAYGLIIPVSLRHRFIAFQIFLPSLQTLQGEELCWHMYTLFTVSFYIVEKISINCDIIGVWSVQKQVSAPKEE